MNGIWRGKNLAPTSNPQNGSSFELLLDLALPDNLWRNRLVKK